MARDVKVAVIGAGFMGGLHARALHEMAYASLVGLADTDKTRCSELASRYATKAYADYRELLDREKPEAVIVATPEFVHREPVVESSKRGCQVFVEKPIASNLTDADSIIESCGENKVKLMVGYILRFEPCYAETHESIKSGTLGKFLSAYARRLATTSEAARLGGRTTVTRYLGVHDFDQILWYHPVRLESVFARAVKNEVFAKYHVPDHVWTMMQFEDGALAVVESGWALTKQWVNWQNPSGWSGVGDFKMNIVGSQGLICVDNQPMNIYAVDDEGWKFPDSRYWPVINEKLVGAVKLELEHFLECILFDREPLVTGIDGRRSLEVALAAERSIDERKEVKLPLEKK